MLLPVGGSMWNVSCHITHKKKMLDDFQEMAEAPDRKLKIKTKTKD